MDIKGEILYEKVGIRMEEIMKTNKTNTICKGMIAVAALACATLFFTGPDAEAKVKYKA